MAQRPDADHISEGDHDEVGESSPLLASPGSASKGAQTWASSTPCAGVAAGEEGQNDHDHQPARLPDEPAHLFRQNVVILVMIIIFTIEMGAVMMQPPTNALMEDAICRTFLPAGDAALDDNGGGGGSLLANDPRCKTPDVQARLATIRGWQLAFDVIPSILCAVPYSLMADRSGRKPVMFLACLGLVLGQLWIATVLALPSVLPLEAVFFSSLFTFIGAFACCGPAMIFTVLSDVVPQADRATVFFRVNVAFLGAELAANPLSGWLMARSGPWLPMIVGLVLCFVCVATITFLPETLGFRCEEDAALGDNVEADVVLAPSSAAAAAAQGQDDTDPLMTSAGGDKVDDGSPLRAARTIVLDSFRELWVFILGNPRLLLLMLPLTFFLLGRLAQEILLQYATKRYDISWSRATFLMAVRSVSNLVLFIAVFPALSRYCLVRLGMSPMTKDLWLSRFCGAVGAAGALLVALSPTPALLACSLVVFSFGYGLSPLVRSLLNALVEQRHLAMVNSLIGFIELFGIFVAGPTLTGALGLGIRLGGAWVGLPFMLAALSFGFATALLWIFRLPREAARERVD